MERLAGSRWSVSGRRQEQQCWEKLLPCDAMQDGKATLGKKLRDGQ
jgi:hypothetical protein